MSFHYTSLVTDADDFAAPRFSEATSSFPTPWREREQTRWKFALACAQIVIANNTGFLLVTAAVAFLSLVNVAVKKLHSVDPPVSTLELIFVRMGITYICCIIYMIWQRVPEPLIGPKGVRMLLAYRGFSGFIGLFGAYYSLEYLTLSDATVLTFLAPLCTGIAGSLVLRENFTRKQALAGIFSLTGVVLIARPNFLFGPVSREVVNGIELPAANASEQGTPAERLVAVGVALIGVLGATGTYTSLRAIGKRAHPLHSLTSYSMLCVIVSATAMVATRSSFIVPNQLTWLALLAMIGIFGFIAQVLLAMGLQRETAGRGTMAIYTQVVFATVLERIFFRSVPSVLSMFGSLIIMASAIYVALTKECTSEENGVSMDRMDDATLEEGLLDSMQEEVLKAEDSSGSPETSDERRVLAVPKGGPSPNVSDDPEIQASKDSDLKV